MSRYPVLLMLLCLVQQAADPTSLNREMAARFESYQARGQAPDERTAFVEWLANAGARPGASADVARAVAHYLELLDESEASEQAFNRIPDENLVGSAEVLRRLDARYGRDPASAVAFARRLADDGYPSLVLFAQWMHRRLGADIVPRPVSTDAAAAAWNFVRDLKGPSASAGSAMALWLEAQSVETDADYARLLGQPRPADPLAYAPRYQLLLYDLIEAKSRDKVLVAEARRLRTELVDGLAKPAWVGPFGPGREKERLRYWLAFGSARVAQSMPVRAGHPYVTRVIAAQVASPQEDTVPPGDIWEDEATRMGGRRQFFWLGAELARTNGVVQQELYNRSAAANWDPTELENLSEFVSRTMPAENFRAFWKGQRFRFVGRLPTEIASNRIAMGDGGASGRWRVFKIWAPTCMQCIRSLESVRAFSLEFPGTFVLLTLGDSLDAANALVKAHDLRVPATSVSVEALRALRAERLPATVLVTPEQRFIVLREADWESEVRFWLAPAAVK